jgi:cytochrome c biogenesis protein CcmG, thiol:disulfide interchange protein DsbE
MATPTNSAPHRRLRLGLLGGLMLVVAVAIVASITLAGGSEGGDQQAAPPVGDPAPTVEFDGFDGAVVTLADYTGRPLVVNFWASWCPSCVAEMSAAFRPVQQSLGDRVDFLGVNLQDERSRALALVEETGVLFDLAEDRTGELYTALEGLGMPFTVFIDAGGSIVHRHNGPVSERQLSDLVEEMLLS